MAFTPFTELDQPTMEAFNEKFQECISESVTRALGADVKMEAGSYVGTGEYGAGTPNSLTLGITPKLLIVVPQNETFSSHSAYMVTVNPQQRSWIERSVGNSAGDHGVTLTWTNKTVSWYNETNAERQLNSMGITYLWVAFGMGETA